MKNTKEILIYSFTPRTRTAPNIEIIKLNNKSKKSNIFNNTSPEFLIKKTQILQLPIDINSNLVGIRFDIEYKIYQMLLQFLIRNISPHVITGAKNSIISIGDKLQLIMYNETFSPEAFHVMNLTNFIAKYAFEDNDEFFEQAFINVFFQIVYTLRCFNLINLKHNDLHTDNILIFINKQNSILSSNFKLKKYNKYTFDGHTIELLDLGIYAFIFDFDGANKNVGGIDISENLRMEIKQPNFTDPIGKSLYNTENNNYADIYKCLFYIVKTLKHFISNICHDVGLIKKIGKKYLILFKLLANFIYLKFPEEPNLEDSSSNFINFICSNFTPLKI
jgi:hypothetical protein